MTKKELEEVFDYLRVLQSVYNMYSWDGRRAKPISVDTVTQVRIFLNYLVSQVGLENIPKPDEVSPNPNGTIEIDWVKIDDKKMDLFSVGVFKSGELFYSSILDTLGTQSRSTSKISEFLDEVLILHLKHFC